MHNPEATAQVTNVIGLYDSNGDLVPGTAKRERNDSSMSTRFFATTSAQAGNYFLGIGNSEPGTYLLSIRTKTDDFPNGSQGTVTVGDEGTLGELEWRYDSDWFKVQLTKGSEPQQRYRIRVGWPSHSSTAELRAGKIYTICYRALNAAGTDCAPNSEITPTGRPSSTVADFTIHADSTYYFEVGARAPFEEGWEFMVIGEYKVTVKEH